MKYIIAVLVGLSIILGFASPAQAVVRPASRTLTVDLSRQGDLPGSTAFREWRQGITTFKMVTGSCSGTGCLHVVRLPEGMPTSWCNNYVGCTYGNADGSCTSEVAYYDHSTAWKDSAKPKILEVTLHEIGHGLGGYNTTPGVTGNLCYGLGHVNECDSVMEPTAGMCIVNGKPLYVTKPSAADYARANAL